MINYSAIGFGIILAVVGVGVDYHQQTKNSGLMMGEMTASAYMQTVTGRFADVQDAKEAKLAEKERKSRVRAGARVYLPEAPEGWTRRELIAGDNSSFTAPKREKSEDEKELLEASTLLRNMAEKSEKKAFEDRNAQTWVYERGDEAVSIRARYTELPKGNTISSNAMTMVIGNLDGISMQEGWDVVQGVAYGFYPSYASGPAKPYRVFNAVVGFGDEIKIDVRTTASDEATREILNLIDYNGLNAMLPRPLAHVGDGASELPDVDGAELASRMIKIRSDLINARTEAAEDWLRSATSPEDAMTLALRQAGFNIEGSMGDADAELDRIQSDLENQSLQTAEIEANLDTPETGQETQVASLDAPQSQIADDPQSPKTDLVSKPLPDEKIKTLQAMSGSERSIAMIGLNVSVRRFETKNGLAEGTCVFSMVRYRVECGGQEEDVKVDDASTSVADNQVSTPSKKTMPKRLQLSGGSSCLDNAIGGLCNN